jgi:hypothetical protein
MRLERKHRNVHRLETAKIVTCLHARREAAEIAAIDDDPVAPDRLKVSAPGNHADVVAGTRERGSHKAADCAGTDNSYSHA